MKQIYYIRAKAEQFQSLKPDIPEPQIRAIWEVGDNDSWIAPPLVIENPLLPRADFLDAREFGLACPRSLVLEHPGSGIERDCDLYPCRIEHESQEYVIFRPRRVLPEEEVFESGTSRVIGRLRESAIASSFLFRKSDHSVEVYAAIVEGPGLPRDNFLDFARSFTGLEWRLLAQG